MGAQIYRSKRDLGNRYNSIDENQFIKKGQEMVHQSFGADDDLSRSYISAKKDARMSMQVALNTSKDDPVLIDWNSKTTNADEKYMNRTNHRTQASLQDAENFFSQHVSQLDAVSEVDSQKGATPFNHNEAKSQTFKFPVKKDLPSTPREGSVSTNTKMEPIGILSRQHSDMVVNNTAQKTSAMHANNQFSPLQIPQQTDPAVMSGQGFNRSFGNLR